MRAEGYESAGSIEGRRGPGDCGFAIMATYDCCLPDVLMPKLARAGASVALAAALIRG